MSRKILVIDDEPDMVELLTQIISSGAGCQVDFDHSGKNGLSRALQEDYNLVIIDVSLPDLEGFEICRQLRANKSKQAILMLTSRSEELDRVLGLELGADDYVTKPFSSRELLARVKALFRRAEELTTSPSNVPNLVGQEPMRYDYGSLSINVRRRSVMLDNVELDITNNEFELLLFLASHPGEVYTRDQLAEKVLGYNSLGYEASVTTHLSRLRRKIEKDPANPLYIKTVYGVGYRFIEKHELPE